MFEIKNVSKQYGTEFALDSVTMNIGKGMNFIVGASGSGKTTLLKIISGMEQDFHGEVVYCGKSMKTLKADEKSYFYNNLLGFVWQDFNLIEEATVLENVLLPKYLKGNMDTKAVDKTLRELKIWDLRNQKVKYLSGGEMQRVAIARELMKNPQVIIADEPTSALEGKTAKVTIDILRALSKNRTVIVVTHDTSLITEKDKVYELDKGELISQAEINSMKTTEVKMQNKHSLSLSNAFSIARVNIKNKIGGFIISMLSLMLAGVLLLTTMSGAINNGSQDEFHKLFYTYGETILDIGIIGSFIDAAGTEGNENNKPKGDVTQNTNGLLERYLKDERVAHIVSLQPYENIKVTVDGKSFNMESSGSAPVLNKLTAGKITSENKGFEVIIPQSVVKKMGVTGQEAIGKEIDFSASILNSAGGKPVAKPVHVKAKIMGVADNTTYYDYGGQTMSFSVDDSFFFNKAAEDEMRKQAETENESVNFTMRAKTPKDLISLKDELNKKGIVPLGQFELVEDMVRLNAQTDEQSGSASMVIGILAVIMVIAVFFTTGVMRKREYAIYKASGFHNKHLCLTTASETVLTCISSLLLLVIASPLLNMATKAMFGADILSVKMLFIGALLIIAVSMLSFAAIILTFAKIDISVALKASDKS